MTAAVFDLDELKPGDDAWLTALTAGELDGVIHSTHSHKNANPRLRLVLPLSRPVPASDWGRFWPTLVAKYGIPADASCTDPSRLYFEPSAPAGGDLIAHRFEGRRPINVDAVLADAPAAPAPPKSTNDAAQITTGGRNSYLASVGGSMRDRGMGEPAIRAALIAENAAKCNPPLDDAEVARVAASVARYRPTTDVAGGMLLAGAMGLQTEVAEPVEESPVNAWLGRDQLAEAVIQGADLEFVPIEVGNDAIVTVRVGGIITLSGPSGAGKTSLIANIVQRHARTRGHVLVLSCELPADEFAARIVGSRIDRSWYDVLTGQIPRPDMLDALPERLTVAPRKNATIENLIEGVTAIRASGDADPMLVVVDYGQILANQLTGNRLFSDVRSRVSAVWEVLDEIGREFGAVVIALSQMARGASRAARSGDRLGAEALDGGAESGAIEHWSSVVLEIGAQGDEDSDGWREVSLSIGKGRMSGGDRVLPMSYKGVTGQWKVTGEALPASEVRATQQEKKTNKQHDADNASIMLFIREQHAKGEHYTRNGIRKFHNTNGLPPSERTRTAVARLITSGALDAHYETNTKANRTDEYLYPRTEAPPAPDIAIDPNSLAAKYLAVGGRSSKE